MKTITIRNIEIGTGIPKICVPIVGADKKEILKQAEALHALPVDVAEWRADWFEDVFDVTSFTEILVSLRASLGNIPLLMTFRTLAEGGEKAIGAEAYAGLVIRAAQTGLVDLVDVEMSAGDEIVSRIIHNAHAAKVFVVVSHHDFDKTPDKEEIVRWLCRMQGTDADILKIAVMPRCKKDVLALLAATEEMVSEYADRPVITMSMADTGAISRLCGEVFGSSMTFGSAGRASAPGQMDVRTLHSMLTTLHKVLNNAE